MRMVSEIVWRGRRAAGRGHARPWSLLDTTQLWKGNPQQAATHHTHSQQSSLLYYAQASMRHAVGFPWSGLLVLVWAATSAVAFFLAPPPLQRQLHRSSSSSSSTAGAAARPRPTTCLAKRPGDHSEESVLKKPHPPPKPDNPTRRGGDGPSSSTSNKAAVAAGARGGAEARLEAGGEQALLERLLETMSREALSEQTLDAVLRVYCTHVQPSFAAPWQRLQQISSTSSGFVISGRRIITNAHSVEYGSIIQIRKRGCDVKWVAELLAYGPECDLAVLTVKDEAFWTDLHPLEFGELPALLDDVSVVGYPIGGESLSVTAGVVSRIELQEYAQGGESLLAIQIDAAINGGNSGGPVINDDDKLVGVAFQTLASHDIENIGYVIPVDILLHFLADIERHGSYTGFCRLGVKFQPMESASLRRFKALPEGGAGILVTKVDPLAPAHGLLLKGDVLMAVDGIPMANDGTIPFRKGERVELHYYFSQLFQGDTVQLRLLRDGKLLEVAVPVYLHRFAVLPHLNNNMPSFFMVGGMVFTVLTHPFLLSNLGETYAPETQADVRLLYLIQSYLQNPAQEIVVLSEVLEHNVNLGYDLFHRQHIKTFNGQAIQNLAHLVELVDACTEGEMVFQFDREEILVLDAAAAHKATQEVALIHGIPSSRSLDLVADGGGKKKPIPPPSTAPPGQ